MKLKALLIFATLIYSTFASAATTACSDTNSQTRIARNSVKALVALADLYADVQAYYGGVESNDNGLMVVNVLPYYKETKDWYKVTIRNSDCRVMSINLYREKILLTLKERESLENGGF